VIGCIIGRTESSVRGVASDNAISLKLTNRWPGKGMQ
jgi:hypothetical protein